MSTEPTTIGRYRVLAKIGQGGMGAVYKAEDPSSGTVVALKVIVTDRDADPRFLERFQREAVAVAAIKHPNVTAFHESGTHGGRMFLALELVSGGSLNDKLKLGPMPWREAATTGAQIARGLAAIHAAGMVHRDLKPANVLLDEQGRAKITDLGIARVRMAGAAALTRTGEVMGTISYMAPEQTEGAKSVGPAADLYALGATLYALLTGRPPFVGNQTEIVTKLLTAMPERPSALLKCVPPELERIVMRLLSKDPIERGIDAASVAAELDALLAAPEPAPPRSRVPLVAGAVVLLGAVAGAAAFLSRGPAGTTPDQSATPVPAPTAPAVPKKNPTGPRSPVDDAPSWYRDLGDGERPALPLPRGLRFGDAKLEYVNKKDGSVLVYVPGGGFEMGMDGRRDEEGPVHHVELSPYFIGKYEVTNAQFDRFARANGYVTSAEEASVGTDPTFVEGGWNYMPILAGGKLTRKERYHNAPEEPQPAEAVVQVSVADVEAYCRWAGLSLPTEAQWERAASWDGKKKRTHAWSGELEPGRTSGPIANLADESLRTLEGYASYSIIGDYRDSFPRVSPVGKFPLDVSPVGALDMAGNVSELCRDIYNTKFYGTKEATQENPLCTVSDQSDRSHVARGHSWAHGRALRSTYRWRALHPAHSDIGFRVVRDLQ